MGNRLQISSSTNFSIFMNHEALSITHSRSQRRQPFPIFIAALHPIYSVIWMAKADTVLRVPLFFIFFSSSPTIGVGLLVWVQFLIHIGSGRWIWSSCSPSLFHFKRRLLFRLTQSPHGYVKWTNMLGTRGERSYFHTKWWSHNSFFFSSAETLIISKTANMGDVLVSGPTRVFIIAVIQRQFNKKLLGWIMRKATGGEDVEE